MNSRSSLLFASMKCKLSVLHFVGMRHPILKIIFVYQNSEKPLTNKKEYVSKYHEAIRFKPCKEYKIYQSTKNSYPVSALLRAGPPSPPGPAHTAPVKGLDGLHHVAGHRAPLIIHLHHHT